MSMDLFIAALLFAFAASTFAYLAATRRLNRRSKSGKTNIVEIESRLADLTSELNHVANSHANAVEDRRDELKRVIEMANERIRRLTILLSDLEIMETRIRTSAREKEDTIVEDDLTRSVMPVKVAKSYRTEIHDEIRNLSISGENPEIIAERLRVPINEVEMVLKAKEKRH